MRIGSELPINPELFTKRIAAIGVALAIDIIMPAVTVLLITLPDHHVTATGQLIDRCINLVVTRKGVGPELTLRIAGEGQLAVTKLDCLDIALQRIDAVVTVRRICVGNRPVGDRGGSRTYRRNRRQCHPRRRRKSCHRPHHR